MGKYSILDDKKADESVQEVLDLVINEICNILGNKLRSIILVGSYGRGEGGVYLKDGEYRLSNDIDLLVFVYGNKKKVI